MGTQISRIAPWQATKVFTIMYFIMGVAFATPMLLLTLQGLRKVLKKQITLGFGSI